MNPPLQFRAWDRRSERMYTVTDLKMLDGQIITISVTSDDDGPMTFETIEEIDVMQATGYVDRNGRPVFEGDIIETAFGRTPVIWLQEMAAWWTMLQRVELPELGSFATEDIEVVGNIWQNAEVLLES